MNSNQKILSLIFTLIMALLMIPLIIDLLDLNVNKELEGVGYEMKEPDFSFLGWFSGAFQEQKSNYINKNFPFHSEFVLSYNQMEYELFNYLANRNVVLGKQKHFFEKSYIESFFGYDFIGEEVIQNNVGKLMAIDSALKARGVALKVVLAPDKCELYPDMIPDYCHGEITSDNNYQCYKKTFNQMGADFLIDMNQWFVDLHPDFDRSLYYKAGTHWSVDASCLAIDTLIRSFERKSGHDLNQIIIESVEKSDSAIWSDDDLFKLANLRELNFEIDYYYPTYNYESDNPNDYKLIAIADSYFWNLFNLNIKKAFGTVKYWYYFSSIYPDSYDQEKKISNIDFEKELISADFVILLATSPSLKNFGWGFIDRAYNELVLQDYNELRILEIMHAIEGSPEWLSEVKKKAQEQGISLKKMIRLDAEYIYYQESANQ